MASKSVFLRNIRTILKSNNVDLNKKRTTKSVLKTNEFPEQNIKASTKESNRKSEEKLLSEFISRAEEAAWKVITVNSKDKIGETIKQICENISAKNVLITNENILSESKIASKLIDAGFNVEMLNTKIDDEESIKNRAFDSDVGITGGDYLIAETGTLAIHPGEGISRLISLVPPVHIAVAEKRQIIPSLDELFLLEQDAHRQGNRSSSMNLISGPSKTGDIEGEIVYGIHGPIETFLILLQ